MKISHIHSQVVRLPVDEPLAGGPIAPGSTREFVALTMGTDQGLEGLGVTFFGGALTGALKAAVDGLGALAIGEDPLRIEAIIEKLRAAAGSSGPGGIFTLALAAILATRPADPRTGGTRATRPHRARGAVLGAGFHPHARATPPRWARILPRTPSVPLRTTKRARDAYCWSRTESSDSRATCSDRQVSTDSRSASSTLEIRRRRS